MDHQLGRLERRRRGERGMRTADEASWNDEKSNFLPYVMMVLGLTLVGFGAWVSLEAGARVPLFAFLIPASVLLALGVSRLRQRRRKAIPPRIGKERELLWAIRDNAGSITPAEAAMETLLTVGEADEMLSGLAGGGHLLVESNEGTLFYKLPERRAPKLGDRDVPSDLRG